MTLFSIMRAEIVFRKLPFALGCLSVAVAVGAVVGSGALLRGHDLRTERLVERQEARMREGMARMEDDYRVIMKRMGYNVMILHRDQDLAELHALGYPTTLLPESAAERLTEAAYGTLNHLLPVLQRRVLWPETGEQILLSGVRGQMALPGARGARAPIFAPIPEGRVALGHTLATRVDVTAGEPVTLMDERFIVERVESPRGTGEDMALWVALGKVQRWLNAPDAISGILALECVCHAESLGQIVEQVTTLLPETQVFEFTSKVRGRAEARKRAGEVREMAIEAEKAQRARLRAERERLAGVGTPLALAGAAVWILILAFGNARDRRGEIGMLRAVGWRQRQIVVLFLSKAALTGAGGGAAGLAAGAAIGAAAAGTPLWSHAALALAGGWRLAWCFLIGPLLACGATLPPALAAAQRDPAEVLARE